MSEQRTISRCKQQFGGLLLFCLGLAGIVGTWYVAIFNGYFYFTASVIFPVICFVGLGAIMFRDARIERTSRGENVSELSSLQMLTARWRVVFVLGLLAGFGNFILLRFF